MSCYIRHLGDVFDALGLENTKENRKAVDLAVREFIGVPGPCGAVWKALKPRLADDETRAEVIAYLDKKVVSA